MFRVSDPLRTYAKDPRDSDVRTSLIAKPPPQSEPQVSQPSSSKIWYIILISLLVLIGAVLFSTKFNQKEKHETVVETPDIVLESGCAECLEYDDISNLASNSEAVEEYLRRKLSNISRIHIDPTSNATLKLYIEKAGYVKGLKEKVDELVSYKEKLGTVVSDAIKSEEKLRRLQTDYDAKIEKIEKLGNESVNYIQGVATTNTDITRWEGELQKINKNLMVKDEDLRGKKQEFYDSLTEMNREIEEKIKGTHMTEEGMHRFVKEREQKIQEIDTSKNGCEISIKEKEKKVGELKRLNQSLSDAMLQVEYQFKQKRLELHSLETTKRLEEVIKQLKSLQLSASEKAKEWVHEITESLKDKEGEYMTIVRGIEGSGYGESKEESLNSLRNAIEKEKKLLTTSVWQQFRTLRLSNEEIRNVTEHLNEINGTIETDREKLEQLMEEKKRVQKGLSEVPGQLNLLRKEIKECQDIIQESQSSISRESKEINEIKSVISRITELRQTMKKRQENFIEDETEVGAYRKGLIQEKDDIEKKLSQAKADLSSIEAEVKKNMKQINLLLENQPTSRALEKEAKVYSEKANVAANLNDKIKEINDQIVKLLGL